MTKYGVCKYDMESYDSEVINLEQFDTYEAAYNKYIKRLKDADKSSCYLYRNLWLVYIENDKIVQFEQLNWKVKCKIVEINN